MPALTASLLTIGSLAVTGAVVGNAWYQKAQFYPAVVYVVKSQSSMAVLYLQALVAVALVGRLFKWLFFGTLRASESENLMEKAWYAVTETCLAFTVFRDDFNPRFVAQFTLLLFLKCFHWLGEERVDMMERSPVISLLFHARMMGLMGLLSACDSYLMSHAYFTTLLRGASVQIVFGFEYAVLMSIVFHLALKYVLHSIDLRSPTPWENKAVYLLYAELVIGFFRVVLYAVFVLVMVRLHTFPLFSIRPMYLTIRAFKKALHDVVMSRRAIYAMNHLFADAKAEDLGPGTDTVCIVCREEMTPGAKKLPCGHIFHTACLRSWFQRQQTCPTCRSDILGLTPTRGGRNPVPPPQPPNPQPTNPAQPNPSPPNQAQSSDQTSASHLAGSATFSPPPPPPGFPVFPTGLPSFSGFPGMGVGGWMPPGFPPPFTLPFPPPPSFAGLSDEEVLAMEGSERAAVEARVIALRNIATLLEAATLQLHQYTSTLASITSSPSFTQTPRAAPPPQVPVSPPQSSHESQSPTQSVHSTPENSQPPPPESPNDDEDEARRIRLRRIQALQNSSNSPQLPQE